MRIEWQGKTDSATVQVFNAEDEQIARFSAEELDQHIASKRLSSGLLIDRSPGAEARLARILVLLACAQACRNGLNCLARDCPLHPSRLLNQGTTTTHRKIALKQHVRS